MPVLACFAITGIDHSPTAISECCQKFKKRELKSLEESLYLPDSICIIDIFEAILYHTDAQPLKKHTGRGLSPHRMGALYCLLRS